MNPTENMLLAALDSAAVRNYCGDGEKYRAMADALYHNRALLRKWAAELEELLKEKT